MLLARTLPHALPIYSNSGGSGSLLLGDFSIVTSEASGGIKTFYSKKLWSVFCNKHLCLYSALSALDFIYSNQEKCHLHTIASYGFCSSRCCAAFVGDYLTNK
jgi:hypothetical protein